MPITVKTHGEYYYKTDTIKGRKHFQVSVRAASLDFFKQTSIKSMGTDEKGQIKIKETEFVNVRGMLKRRLLPIVLAKKFSDFARIRSVSIDEIISDDGENLDLPLSLMSRDQIAAHVKSKRFPIDCDSYIDIDELRADVFECLDSVDSFVANKTKKDKKRQEEREFMVLNGLNPDARPPSPVPTKVIIKKENTINPAMVGAADFGGPSQAPSVLDI